MGTITDKLQQLAQTKDAIKAAIIRMGQPVADSDPFSAYAGKITSIKTGVDTSDATAAAGDILSGKVAYSGGQRVEGTIPSMGAVNLTASGATVTVPAGYYPSAVSKAVDTATQATPAISVGSNGLITASATQSAGYVSSGTKSATKQMTVQAAATITPGTAAKTAVAAGRYTTGAVTVAGDSNLVPSNIRSGASIFGVAGSAVVFSPTMVQGDISTINAYGSSVYVVHQNEYGDIALESLPIMPGIFTFFVPKNSRIAVMNYGSNANTIEIMSGGYAIASNANWAVFMIQDNFFISM